MNSNEILEWLRNHKFEVKYSEFFYPKYIFCENNQTNVIIKEYIDNNVSNNIRSDAVDIRSILNKLGENVWNTYFLIGTKSEQQLISYSIEKDSVGLRKYVINSKADFKRIPSLDIETTLPEKTIGNTDLIKTHSNKDENINKLIDQIISFDGLQRDLNDNEIVEILKNLYGDEVIVNED